MTEVASLAGAPLCLVVLTYVKPIEAVDALMTEHVAFLRQGIERGVFLVAGRQVPRVGGVLLARGRKAEVEPVALADPFVTGGVATVTVTEIAGGVASTGFAALLA